MKSWLLSIASVTISALVAFQCIAQSSREKEIELRQRIVSHLDALAHALDSQSDQGYNAGRRIANAAAYDVPNLTESLRKQREFGELMGVVKPSEASDAVRDRLVQEIIAKADTLDGYAKHVRSLQKVAMTAPLDDVLRTLQTSYVPPEVNVVVGSSSARPGEPATASTGQPLPFAAGATGTRESGLLPFIVGLGDSTVDYPAVAAILYTDPRTTGLFVRCSGTLIAPHVVLTAQHCLTLGGPPKAVYFQHAGLYRIASTEGYPGFSMPANDLAVIFLCSAVKGITPVSLNRSGIPHAQTAGRIVGFGYHSDASGAVVPLTGIKIFGDVAIGPCPAKFSNNHVLCWNFTLTPLMANLPSSTCEGDSGGPLFVYTTEWQLVGVTSGSAKGGAVGCHSGDTAIDTEISYYAPWLDKQVSRNVPGPAQGATIPDPLLPAIDNSPRFIASATQGVFDSTASWSTRFDFAGTANRILVAVNATPSGAPIRITVGHDGAPPTCSAVRSDDTAVFCELASPGTGTYAVSITGAPWQEYQLVTTSF